MSERQQFTVPENVLMHMLHGVTLDTVELIRSTWEHEDFVHPGDPFGAVWLWLWRVDPDRAVTLLSSLLWDLRRVETGGTEEITLDKLLRGMQLFALQDVQPGELDGLRDKVIKWATANHGGDPNSTN